MKNQVLIIDDEERTRATVRRLELIHDLPVDVADNPQAGLDMARNQSYKVIIFDIMMPIDGELESKINPSDLNNKYGLLTGLLLLKNLIVNPGKSEGFKGFFFSARNINSLRDSLEKLSLKEGKEFIKFFRKPIDTETLFMGINKFIEPSSSLN